MWESFGFTKNPYDTHPVKGDEVGRRLLVGRAKELGVLTNRIRSINNLVSIEGPNGVGKTSLVLVAGHILETETKTLGKGALLLLPQPFQLGANQSVADFKRQVYARIVSYLNQNATMLCERIDFQANLKPLVMWQQDPIIRDGSVSFAGFGGGLGQSTNETSGFDQFGFFQAVEEILASSFDAGAGIICIIDNLEILNTSRAARNAVEEMRDDLFSKPGLRWVLCGARGIVKSVASSPRLQGRIQEPYEVQPLATDTIGDLLQARMAEFAASNTSVPPVGVDSFNHLFKVLNRNLRDAFKYSADFALWIYERKPELMGEPEQLHAEFLTWLSSQARSIADASQVPPRAWKLFDDICLSGGSISPSDYEAYGFNSSQAMRGQIAPLENNDLINSEVDETDNRRRTITITAKGWLVRHHRELPAVAP